MKRKANVIPFAPLRRWQPCTPFAAGVAFLVVIGFVVLVLANKAPLLTKIRSGETITAEFDSSYRLRPNESKVKLAGLKVGTVSSVEYTDRGTAMVSMKVDETVMDALGPEPTAVIAPLTILGGVYSVELRPGGGHGLFADTFIPIERTKIPVELDRVLEAIPGDTRESLQNVVGRLRRTLAVGGRQALRDVLAQGSATLRPADQVFRGLRGTRPGTDLPQVVSNFYTIADVLSEDDVRLDEIIDALDATTHVLGSRRQALAAAFAELPHTLRISRAGLGDLEDTLVQLTTTADSFRPSARSLAPLLEELNPVLRNARPLMRDLRPLVRDLGPVVDKLVPAAVDGTEVLGDISGPVIDRVNGPVTDTVMNPWRGKGPYDGNGGGRQADHKFYQELGYLTANMDRASMTQDAQGTLLGFQVAIGPSSLAGVPFTLDNLLGQLATFSGSAQ